MHERLRSGRHHAGPTQLDRGSAVVETALMLPVLLAFTALALTAMAITSTALHLGDSAHDLARALARGVPASQVYAAAAQIAPDAVVDITDDEGSVEVTLRQEVSIPVPLLQRFSISLKRSATAPQEWA